MFSRSGSPESRPAARTYGKIETHAVLMKDLQHAVDVVEGVNSSRAALFGLRDRERESYRYTAQQRARASLCLNMHRDSTIQTFGLHMRF